MTCQIHVVFVHISVAGMSFQDLHHEFRIGRSTINEFVPEVLSALYVCLNAKYMKVMITLQSIFSTDPDA